MAPVARPASAGRSPPRRNASPVRRQPPLWQHPFVDVFKTFSADTGERKGDVVEELDRQISRRVFRIRGAISANNYLRLPPPPLPKEHAGGHVPSSLGLTGEYVYLQIRAIPQKFFLVHMDLTVASVNVLRITLSNMYTDLKATYKSVQCPCHLPQQWSTVCVHIPSVLSICGRSFAPHGFVLKAIQFCSTMCVRNAFTSDNRYTFEDMPRDMRLDHQSTGDSCVWVDVPGHYAAVPAAERSEDMSQSRADAGPRAASLGRAVAAAASPSRSMAFEASTIPNAQPFDETVSGSPDPLLEVSHLVGVSRKCRKIAGMPSPVPRRSAVFVRLSGPGGQPHPAGRGASGVLCASSMALTLVDPSTNIRRCYFGHSRPIELLEASDDGLWAASVEGMSEGGAPPLVRLWRSECAVLRCLSVLSCPALTQVMAVAFDPTARFLALAGVDPQGRQQLRIWDISRILTGGSISLHAKQTSADWDIDCVRFSPFEQGHLVTCGKENIRFWRVKDSHLPGCSVVLNSFARQSHFTCIAFEFNKMGSPVFLGEQLGEHQRMFVGTAKGKLLQLSYKDRKVQAVFQLHNEAITSICANEGFVVTASADKYVRVWPLDFKSFYLHAMHDAPVSGVDLTVDGMQVLCSTVDGAVGLLDMQNHNYSDLVHAHAAPIADAAVSHTFGELATASRDGTLKIWNLALTTQTHEFSIEDDTPRCVAFHPGARHLVAVGFESGALRVFDVDGPAMILEARHHSTPIISLVFVEGPIKEVGSTRSALLVTCDATGALVFHDEARKFEVVRCPEQEPCAAPPENCSAIACAFGRLVQYQDPNSAALLSFPSLSMIRRLRVPSSAICTLDFSRYGRFVVLGTMDCRLHLFEAGAGVHAVTYSLASGPPTAVALAEPNPSLTTGSTQGNTPLMLIAATADGLLRASHLQSPPPRPAQPKDDCASTAPLLVTGGDAEEQCFMGHALAPHRVLLAKEYLVTASSSEVICWDTNDRRSRAMLRGSPRLSVTYGEPATPKREPGELTRLVTPPLTPPKVMQSMSMMSQPPPQTPGTGPDGLDTSAEQEDGEADDEEELHASPIKPASPRRLGNLELVALSGCAVDRGPQSFAWQPRLGVLCHALGSSVRIERLPFGGLAAQASPRGGGAVLERLPGGQAFAVSLDPAGGSTVAVLSAAESGEGPVWLSAHDMETLAVRSAVELPEAYTIKRLAKMMGLAPQARAPTSPRGLDVSLARAWSPHPLLKLLPGGVGAVTAVGPADDSGERNGRVDVWIFDKSAGSSLKASAELSLEPLEMALLAGDGSEFLTLSATALIFWRCPPEEELQGTRRQLQFQMAEVPEPWATAAGYFSSFCTAKGPASMQLLLAGTTEGRIRTYSADENRALGEVKVPAGGEGDGDVEGTLSAIACGKWPLVVCSAGEKLYAVTMTPREQGGSLDCACAAEPLTLDGSVLSVQMDRGLPEEGLASTSANTIWYFHVGKGLRVPVQTFHSAPARALRSNGEVLATCDDDGAVRFWKCSCGSSGAAARDPGAAAQAIAELPGAGTPCVAICFLRPHIIACGFVDGRVTAVNLEDMSTLASAVVLEDDRLLSLEATSASSALVGTSEGRLYQLLLRPSADEESFVGSPRAAAQAERRWEIRELHGPNPTSAVCGIAIDADSIARSTRILACFAGLELWVWKISCEACPVDLPRLRHERAWIWPETRPSGSRSERHGPTTQEGCLEFLSSPPLLASFVPSKISEGRPEGLVAVAAPPASCVYVYSCHTGTVVNRVELGPKMPPVLRLMAPNGTPELWVIARDRFARLRTEEDSATITWLSEPRMLPGAADGSRPDGCVVAPAKNEGDSPVVLIKAGTALSSWVVDARA